MDGTFFYLFLFFRIVDCRGGSAAAEDLTADYADGTDNRNSQNDQDQMSTNDPNGREILSKENHSRRSLGGGELIRVWQNVALRPDICGCGDAIVFSRLRPDYGAKEEADPPLAQRAEALPKVDPRKRPRNSAAINV